MAWERTTTSREVVRGPADLHGLVILSTLDDAGVSVYDGRDATSGYFIGEFQAEAAKSTPFNFREPIYCENGIYLTLDTGITEVLVIYVQRRG
jgi:hypothetical protein